MQFKIHPENINHGAMLIITTDGLLVEELAVNHAINKIWGAALFWASDWNDNQFAREPLNKTNEWIENSIPILQEEISQFLIRMNND